MGLRRFSSYHVAALHSLTQSKSRRIYAPRYLSHAMPWSRLFGSNRGVDLAGRRPATGLLDQIRRNLLDDTVSAAQVAKRLYDDQHIELTHQLNALRNDIREGEGRRHRRSQLPPYAEAILARHQSVNQFEDEFALYRRAPATYVLVTDVSTFGIET